MPTLPLIEEHNPVRRRPGPRGPRSSRPIAEQRRLLRLLRDTGCDYVIVGRYLATSRQAVQRWAHGRCTMPASAYARCAALLPWSLLDAQLLAAGRMDAEETARLARLEREADKLVLAALDDPALSAMVEQHWEQIFQALRSPAGREAVNTLVRRYAAARPEGPAQ